ncbi:hypothetical protein BB560_002775 [Smittium megazygosporum]|uniref:Kinesin motor domain-containing protein n=1 Tax=Smittium megazygosporum TaxID=133381 RepID=A0A2T9ZDY5_9FUNG|nr:hypothetical protein BB560_002775 [Smittium megazygosporum]
MNSANLLKLLALNNLEHLLPNILDMGVNNFHELAEIEIPDYERAGVTTIEEFEKLKELITHLRKELQISDVFPPESQKPSETPGSEPFAQDQSNFENFSKGKDSEYYDYEDSENDIMEYEDPTYESEDLDDDNSYSDIPEPNYTKNSRARTFSFSINNGIEEDLVEPEKVVRFGTSTKNSLVNAYGIPVKSKPRQNISQFPNNKVPPEPRSPVQSTPASRIFVCVRKRPLNDSECKRAEQDIISTSEKMLAVHESKKKVDLTKYIEEHRFAFDRVFNENESSSDVYYDAVFPLVDHIFNGGNATCFAYGQTGSGKTYTMLDPTDGLYKLAGSDIFERLKQKEYSDIKVVVVFYEIYLNDVYDLLNNRNKLHALEKADRNVCIKDLYEVSISSVRDLVDIFEFGNKNRSVGSTGANADSSRSHAIIQIQLRKSSPKSSNGITFGKLSFIDLAGNERGADRGEAQNDSTTRREGSEINKSLLALKECIRSLDMGKSHKPFRQSKLTLILRDSFIGNSMCCMIATIAPNTSNCENTLNTLRYADRTRIIRVKNSSPVASKSPFKPSSRNQLLNKVAASSNKTASTTLNRPEINPRLQSANSVLDFKSSTKLKEPSPLSKSKLTSTKSVAGMNRMLPQTTNANAKNNQSSKLLSNFSQASKAQPDTSSQVKSTFPRIGSGSGFEKPPVSSQRVRGGTINVPSDIPTTRKSPETRFASISRSGLDVAKRGLQSKSVFIRQPLNNQIKTQSTANLHAGEKELSFNQLSISETNPNKPSFLKSPTMERLNPRNVKSPVKRGMLARPKTIYHSQAIDDLKFSKNDVDSKAQQRSPQPQSSGSEKTPPNTLTSLFNSSQGGRIPISNSKDDDTTLLDHSITRDVKPSTNIQGSVVSGTKKPFSSTNASTLDSFMQSDDVLENIDSFMQNHIKHINFLKGACREEILSMVTYNTLNKNKFNLFSLDPMQKRISVRQSTNDSSLFPSSGSKVNEDSDFFEDNLEIKEKYEISEFFETYESSNNKKLIRRVQDGKIFHSLGEAQKQSAHEYLLQLDCILEAEMDEIKHLRQDLSFLLKNNFS